MAKRKQAKSQSSTKTCTLHVDGMHCASCEVLIEKKLLKHEGFEAVDANQGQGKVTIVYEGADPDAKKLSSEFKALGYQFSNQPFASHDAPLLSLGSKGELLMNPRKALKYFGVLFLVVILITGFLLLERSGLASLVTVNATSPLPLFFLFGVAASLASCAALVGGVLLSMAKQWNEVYIDRDTTWERAQPHVLFHIGRLISFTVLGGVLGIIGLLLGKVFSAGGEGSLLPVELTAFIIMLVSVLMLVLGLQMLGVKWAGKLQLTMPKFLGRFIANEENFQGKWAPMAVGAGTFFLPCGFTIVVQTLALTTGNPLQSALMLLLFALGTLPMLGLISFSGVGLTRKPHFTAIFNLVAGMLVIFFAVYNFNSQLNVFSLPSLSDITTAPAVAATTSNNAEVQVISMEASSYGYSPSNFTVKAGVPVRWEINDIGTSGCTNAIIARGLITGQVNLRRGMNIVEFTPTQRKTYKFSCWMGMVTGTINVV